MAQKLNLLEITTKAWPERWKALKEHLASEGVELVSEIKETQLENFESVLKESLSKDYDVCKLDPELSYNVTKFLPKMLFDVLRSKSCNLVCRENGDWWPRIILDDAFSRALAQKGGKLDLIANALIVGAGPAAYNVATALVKLGYSAIHIAAQDELEGQNIIQELKKVLFQVDFQFIPFSTITTLPGAYSVVVNTVALDLEDLLLEELYFFNFLKRGGVVVDFNLIPFVTPLVEEARQWGARFLSGEIIAAYEDAVMVEHCLKKKIDVEAYLTKLRSEAEKVKFDIAPYLQRFRGRV